MPPTPFQTPSNGANLRIQAATMVTTIADGFAATRIVRMATSVIESPRELIFPLRARLASAPSLWSAISVR
jgi:hypothetical protein